LPQTPISKTIIAASSTTTTVSYTHEQKRIGRNPNTGAELKIKASKVPIFKAGATLKATVNNVVVPYYS
jgi:nucleoid DNA-binding protein